MVNHTHCRTQEQDENGQPHSFTYQGLSVCLDSALNYVLGLKQVLGPFQSCLIRNNANSINSFRTLETNQLRHKSVNKDISARSRKCAKN